MLITAHITDFMTLGGCNLQPREHCRIPRALSLAQNRCSINTCLVLADPSTAHDRAEFYNGRMLSRYWHKAEDDAFQELLPIIRKTEHKKESLYVAAFNKIKEKKPFLKLKGKNPTHQRGIPKRTRSHQPSLSSSFFTALAPGELLQPWACDKPSGWQRASPLCREGDWCPAPWVRRCGGGDIWALLRKLSFRDLRSWHFSPWIISP